MHAFFFYFNQGLTWNRLAFSFLSIHKKNSFERAKMEKQWKNDEHPTGQEAGASDCKKNLQQTRLRRIGHQNSFLGEKITPIHYD